MAAMVDTEAGAKQGLRSLGMQRNDRPSTAFDWRLTSLDKPKHVEAAACAAAFPFWRVKFVTDLPSEPYVFFTLDSTRIGSNRLSAIPPPICPLRSLEDGYMDPENAETFNLTRMLRRWKWPPRTKPGIDDTEYANLLRYTLQIAAEREIAADVLAELSELLERNAPSWYADEQHARVESALELLQRL